MAIVPKIVPCGAHYYRPPSPKPSEWEKDLRKMKSLGFNMVEYWVMWRWQNPDEGVYQYQEIDKLMDLAAEIGLKVNLSIKYDSVPVWVIQKYPEATITTIWGRKLGPQDTPARQIGGLGCACINHDPSAKIKEDFIRETVRRYQDHPALAIWNSWGEPDMGHSLYRVVGKSDSNIDFMTCYCESCQAKFIPWLEKKYKNIAALNEGWSKNYRNWNDVEVPVARDTFVPMTDWRNFHIERVTVVNKEMMETVRSEDKTHPVMVHTHSLKYFDLMSTGVDLWKIAEPGDLHGATLTDDPFACDMMRSAAKGKPIWSVEIHAVPGMTMVFPYAPQERDIKFFTFVPLAAGFTGFQYWQYRPELLGREAPAWGLTKPDGSETPWLREAVKNFKVLTDNRERVLNFKRQPTETALLWSPDCQLFSWNSYGSEYFYHDSLQGMHLALYENSHVVDFVHPKEVVAGILKNYRILLLAMPMYLEPEILDIIKQWVKDGGTLIAETHFGAVDPKDGRWQMKIPGFGFAEVFGCQQDLIRACRDWSNERADITVKKDMLYISVGQQVRGMICEETLLPDTAEVLAEFAQGGEAAITRNQYGKGQAIYIGTILGHDIWKNRGENEIKLLLSLVEEAATNKLPKARGGRVRVDLLTDDKGGWLIVGNQDKKNPAEPQVWFPGDKLTSVKEIFSGEEIELEQENGGFSAKVLLSEGEIKVFDIK
ncbi:beta-galactosidase [bacterium]|nr:beta-galactosidase [bacterium]